MSKPNLLLVDGDARTRRVLEVSLRKAGFLVATAGDGVEAWTKVLAAPPDLIISDTQMPKMDGFDFCQRLKTEPELAQIPFMFLTKQRSIEDKIRGLELGVEEYLTKPIFVKEIVVRIKMLLQRRQRENLAGRDGRTTFSGDLTDMAVVDLIQTLELGRKSGIIHFYEGDRRGAIFFRDGKIIDAELGHLQAERAVYRLLIWNEGSFDVEFRTIRRKEAIPQSNQALLMEGMRRVDEWGRLLEQLPPLDSVFEVDYGELANRLGEIPDEMNAVIRLFDGRRALMQIVDDSASGDLETLETIGKLFFEGLIFDTSPERPARREPVSADEEGEPGGYGPAEQPRGESFAEAVEAEALDAAEPVAEALTRDAPQRERRRKVRTQEYALTEPSSSRRMSLGRQGPTEPLPIVKGAEPAEPVTKEPSAPSPQDAPAAAVEQGRAASQAEEPVAAAPSPERAPAAAGARRRTAAEAEELPSERRAEPSAPEESDTADQPVRFAALTPAAPLLPLPADEDLAAKVKPSPELFAPPPAGAPPAKTPSRREKVTPVVPVAPSPELFAPPLPGQVASGDAVGEPAADLPEQASVGAPAPQEAPSEDLFAPAAPGADAASIGDVGNKRTAETMGAIEAPEPFPPPRPLSDLPEKRETSRIAAGEIYAPQITTPSSGPETAPPGDEAPPPDGVSTPPGQAQPPPREAAIDAWLSDPAASGGEVIPFPKGSEGARDGEEKDRPTAEVNRPSNEVDHAAREAAARQGTSDPNAASIDVKDEAFFSSEYQADPYEDEFVFAGRQSSKGKWVFFGVIGAALLIGAAALYHVKTSPYYGDGPEHLQIKTKRAMVAPDQRAPAAPPDAAPLAAPPDAAALAAGGDAKAPASVDAALAGGPYRDLVSRAAAFAAKGNKSAALRLYKQALAAAPDGWEALSALALADMEAGNMKRAGERADRALAAFADAPDALLVKGMVLVEQGKKAEAKVSFERYLALCPNCPYTKDIRSYVSKL